MRRLLERREAIEHDSFAALVQRFSMVDKPTPETGRWVSARMKDATREKNTNRKVGSPYALGSVSDHLRQNGNEAEARMHEEELRDALRHAEDDAMLAYLITALANTDTWCRVTRSDRSVVTSSRTRTSASSPFTPVRAASTRRTSARSST